MARGSTTFLATLLALAAMAASANTLSVDWPKERKKVVAFGWEWGYMPIEHILEYADKIDETGIDGISLYIQARDVGGRAVRSSDVIDGIEWTDAMLASQVSTLRRATAHRGLRESFIRTLGAPKERIDWADDTHWARVAMSMATLARFAKATGIRGIIVDPEDYHGQGQFEVRPCDAPYDVLAPLARRRGREIFSGVFAEYPEIVVLGYWLFSWHPQHILSSDPMASARSAGDLWPAFINGILDAMPPQATLVDGDEWCYKSEASQNEFMVSASSQRNAVLGMVAPENRHKFRAQARPGFGLFLDSYVMEPTKTNGETNKFYFGPENGSRLGHFERNLSEALESASEYVWLWCERNAWIKWGDDVQMGWGVGRTLWEERLPGLSRTLRACANPDYFLEKDYPTLLSEGKLVNIATNDYVAASRRALYGNSDNVEEAQHGQGYFHIEVPTALPGQHYVVDISGTGEGLETIAFWQRRKSGGWWRWRIPGHGFAFRHGPDGHFHAREVVRVPEGVDCMAIQFRLHPPKGMDCVFDNVFVSRIPE